MGGLSRGLESPRIQAFLPPRALSHAAHSGPALPRTPPQASGAGAAASGETLSVDEYGDGAWGDSVSPSSFLI